MLELVKKGYALDPPGMAMYVPKTDSFGRPLVDKDDLKLFCSVRGTSNLESLQQVFVTLWLDRCIRMSYSPLLDTNTTGA